jgi:hypothetical protein
MEEETDDRNGEAYVADEPDDRRNGVVCDEDESLGDDRRSKMMIIMMRSF